MRELYGDYYVSEMMRYPEEKRKLIVVESQGRVTTVMIFNRQVDVDLLNEFFELDPYNCLKKYLFSIILYFHQKLTAATDPPDTREFQVTQWEKKWLSFIPTILN